MKRTLRTLPVILFIAVATIACKDNASSNDTISGKDSTAKNKTAEIRTVDNSSNTNENIALEPLTLPDLSNFGNSENLDTLSYIIGMEIANQIEKDIIPQFKADYNVIVETLEKGLNGNKVFKVEGVTVNKESLQELGMKYFGPEIGPKIQAAMADSTGMTDVFDTPAEKRIASTLLGADFVFRLENTPFKINAKKFMQGVNDIHNGKQMLSNEKAREFMEYYFTVVVPAQNDKLSQEWLAGIEKEDGVKKTASGLLYKIVKAGDTNKKATKDTDVVKVLYTGKTRKDVTFDSNRWNDMPAQRKEMIKAYQPDMAKDNPIEFPLNGVIPGWTEGMKLVGKGGRIHLWIPSELAYGKRAASQEIGPNEALFFDVELLEVTPAK